MQGLVNIILVLKPIIAREEKSTQEIILTIGKIVIGNAENIMSNTAELYGTYQYGTLCDKMVRRI